VQLLTAIASISLIAAACGGDDDDADTTDAPSVSGATEDTSATSAAPSDDTTADGTTAPDSTEGGDAAAGGEFMDGGTFVGDPPEHIDPALNSTLDAYQVINAMYDGLTDIDSSDPEKPVIKPHVAESFESNDDATVWTFKIRDGMAFSDGEPILPSTFQRSWERASSPESTGDYTYLFNFIQGGAEKVAGEAETLAGVVADDEAMTLTVTLAAPYSNFPAVAGFQLFFPMPEGAGDVPGDYENGPMIGNGPYSLDGTRTDEEIVLVKNDTWTGDIDGETWPDRLEKITFLTFADPDTSYNALAAGETMTANIPPARATEAEDDFGTTLDVSILGSYHFQINDRAPEIGGDANLKLRQAISMAIDRDKINSDIYNGTRNASTGITPPGIPGFKADLCDYCTYDPEGAQAAFDEWTAAGNTQAAPLKIQFGAGAGHEDVVAIVIQNLATIGIEAEADPRPTETYFTEMGDGGCVICRSGWFADYPTYDNFMFDQYATESLGGNNFGFSNTKFDELLAEAKQTVDLDEQASLFQQTEEVLLNEQVGTIPINWYRGDYAYDDEQVSFFTQSNFGLIPWEKVTLAG
jgi:ABC-type oligopeptide transport system substrate-binding subunit